MLIRTIWIELMCCEKMLRRSWLPPCDASHRRWSKLLGVRAGLHPKIRLQEYLSIYSITLEFINPSGKIGRRLGYCIRVHGKSQAKAFVDFEAFSMNLVSLKSKEEWDE